MIDLLLIFFFKNTIIVSIVFWLLTIFGSLLFEKTEYKYKEDIYECGFKSTSDINFNLNYSFLISAIFLLIYDIELIFLIPFLFNYDIFNYNVLFIFFIFIFFIFLTLILDILTNSIKWNF